MNQISRREFHTAALGAVGASVLGASVAAAEEKKATLPTVRWGKYQITRLLVGHNPIKGQSHFSGALDKEMGAYFGEDERRGVALLHRSQQMGINTCQMGGTNIESMLRAHYAEGGNLQWIATFYSKADDLGKAKDELKRILQMDPKPIGAQLIGNNNDALMRQRKLEKAQDLLKLLRDAGLLVGFGAHNHETIDAAADKGFDVDFFQCCFYHSCFGLDGRRGEIFEEPHRQAMVNTIRQLPKPCIAFKVLGANRHCSTAAGVEGALRFALEKVKPTDVVLVGMWQKHKDQVAENTAYARKILGMA